MKTTKKLLALLLAGVMLIGATACGGEDEDSNGGDADEKVTHKITDLTGLTGDKDEDEDEIDEIDENAYVSNGLIINYDFMVVEDGLSFELVATNTNDEWRVIDLSVGRVNGVEIDCQLSDIEVYPNAGEIYWIEIDESALARAGLSPENAESITLVGDIYGGESDEKLNSFEYDILIAEGIAEFENDLNKSDDYIVDGLEYKRFKAEGGYWVVGIGTYDDPNLVIPSTVRGTPVIGIHDSAFEACTSITGVVLPDGIKSIGNFAFNECENLTDIEIPDSVSEIGVNAFNKCKKLTGITIPESVSAIEYGTFSFCESITEIVLPDSVTSIAAYAFYGCKGLERVNIPDSVTFLECAFQECKSLTAITIPGSVEELDNSVFLGCYNLEKVVIGDGMTAIHRAFGECSALTSITIPASVTMIDSDAFDDCDNLTIIGTAGSYAETYANEHDIPFQAQ